MRNHERFMELNNQANMLMSASEKVKGPNGDSVAFEWLMKRHSDVVSLMCACTRADVDERGIVYTTKGDFTHIAACGIGFPS